VRRAAAALALAAVPGLGPAELAGPPGYGNTGYGKQGVRAWAEPPRTHGSGPSQTQQAVAEGQARGRINAAKSAETRQRRIDKAVALFLDGKQR
jgi:hypothetical protein